MFLTIRVVLLLALAAIAITDAAIRTLLDISSTELNALHDIYIAANGFSWNWLTSPTSLNISVIGNAWDFSVASPNPCTDRWQGITCNCSLVSINNGTVVVTSNLEQGDPTTFVSITVPAPQCTVSHIELINYNMSGYLSHSIGNLTSLVGLTMSLNPMLRGAIPHELGNLGSSLRTLDLHLNNFTGTLPSSLGQLVELTFLSLANNSLTGSLLSEIGQMKSLELLDLDFNKLSSTLPAELGNLESLTALYMSFNAFSGGIPESFSALSNLKDFHIASNYLSGTLPLVLTELTRLESLNLGHNNFTGSIAAEYATMASIEALYLSSNALSGPLPIGFFQASASIKILDVTDNFIEGNISYIFSSSSSSSSSTGFVSGMYDLYLGSNLLTGSLPEDFSNLLPDLYVLELYSNFVTNAIPNSICDLQNLIEIQLYDNGLHSTIPNCLGNLTNMLYIGVSNNHLTGTLPAGISSWRFADYVDVGHNMLTNTLPSTLGNLHGMRHFYVNNNLFTGVQPHTLRNMVLLETYDISYNIFSGPLLDLIGTLTIIMVNDNILSGTVPQSYANNAKVIQTLFLNENRLTGPLPDFTSPLVLTSLQSVDFSNNAFTGLLVSGIFNSTSLSSFAAVGNCLSGKLPLTICNAVNLRSLALDGMHASNKCQVRFFPRSFKINTYFLKDSIAGEVYECLLQMQNLESLHLSGNAINGYLDNDAIIGPNLVNLSLSHNELVGSIPPSLQMRPWSTLDLSNNRLSGVLYGYIPKPNSNSSLRLNVNRLSGRIPQSLRSAEKISILEGNLFKCKRDRSNLPKHDGDAPIYKCGSDAMNLSLLMWGGTVFLVVITLGVPLGVVFFDRRQQVVATFLEHIRRRAREFVDRHRKNCDDWSSVFMIHHKLIKIGHPELYLLGNLFESLRKSFAYIVAFIVVALLPVYWALSFTTSSYSNEYAWSWAAILLSGKTPGTVVLSFLILFLVVGCIVVDREVLQRNSHLMSGVQSRTIKIIVEEDRLPIWKHYAKLMLILVIDIIIVIPIDALYVYIITRYGVAFSSFAQVGMAMFKIFWNDLGVRKMIGFARNYILEDLVLQDLKSNRTHWFYDREVAERYLTSVLVIVNTILIPCCAIMAVSSQCFYNVIVEPKTITSTYTFYTCDRFLFTLRNGFFCVTDALQTRSTTFNPPFLYSYECSAFIVIHYSVVYLYAAIGLGFLAPLVKLISRYWLDRSTPGSLVHSALSVSLPLNIREIEEDISLVGVTVFDKDKLLMRTSTHFVVLFTFGAIFPPLAVVQLTCLISYTYYEQLAMGRLIYVAEKKNLPNYTAVALRECRDTLQAMLHTLWLVVPTAAIFYSFIVFDIIGDATGMYHALWAPIVMLSTPFVLLLVVMCLHYFNRDSKMFQLGNFTEYGFRRVQQQQQQPRETELLGARAAQSLHSIYSFKDSEVGGPMSAVTRGSSTIDSSGVEHRPSVWQRQIYQYEFESRKTIVTPSAAPPPRGDRVSDTESEVASLWTRGSSFSFTGSSSFFRPSAVSNPMRPSAALELATRTSTASATSVNSQKSSTSTSTSASDQPPAAVTLLVPTSPKISKLGAPPTVPISKDSKK